MVVFLIALLAIVSQSLRQFGLCSEKAAPLRAAAINPVRVSDALKGGREAGQHAIAAGFPQR